MNYSNGKLGYKENLTYKQLEKLIKEASRKLNKENLIKEQVENLIKEISLGFVLKVLSTITQHKRDNLQTY